MKLEILLSVIMHRILYCSSKIFLPPSWAAAMFYETQLIGEREKTFIHFVCFGFYIIWTHEVWHIGVRISFLRQNRAAGAQTCCQSNTL